MRVKRTDLRNNGKFISKKDFEKVTEIKKAGGKKLSYKAAASKYFAGKVSELETKPSPVNSLYENVSGYAARNRNLKIYIKEIGATKYKKVNLAEYELKAAEINSKYWNISNDEKKKGTKGTLVPMIEVSIEKISFTQLAEKIYIDFNTIFLE